MSAINLTNRIELSKLATELVENLDKEDLLEFIVRIQKAYNDHSWPYAGIELEIPLIRHFKAVEQEILLDYKESLLDPPDTTPFKINL